MVWNISKSARQKIRIARHKIHFAWVSDLALWSLYTCVCWNLLGCVYERCVRLEKSVIVDGIFAVIWACDWCVVCFFPMPLSFFFFTPCFVQGAVALHVVAKPESESFRKHFLFPFHEEGAQLLLHWAFAVAIILAPLFFFGQTITA
jgi:hypothetical protein